MSWQERGSIMASCQQRTPPTVGSIHTSFVASACASRASSTSLASRRRGASPRSRKATCNADMTRPRSRGGILATPATARPLMTGESEALRATHSVRGGGEIRVLVEALAPSEPTPSLALSLLAGGGRVAGVRRPIILSKRCAVVAEQCVLANAKARGGQMHGRGAVAAAARACACACACAI
eukprot:scaffold142271_cov31-Tisochrysis_lutea.AAC.2